MWETILAFQLPERYRQVIHIWVRFEFAHFWNSFLPWTLLILCCLIKSLPENSPTLFSVAFGFRVSGPSGTSLKKKKKDLSRFRRRNPHVVFVFGSKLKATNIWCDQKPQIFVLIKIKRHKYLISAKLKATNIRSDQKAQIFGVTSGEEIQGWQSPSKQLPTWVVDQAPGKFLQSIWSSTWKCCCNQFSGNQFDNGGNPSMLLLLEQNAQPTQIQNLNCSWGDKHKFPFICGFSFLHPQILMVCNGPPLVGLV